MEFHHNFTNPPKHFPEKNSGELLVEKGGVLSLSERVKLATLAGYKLEMNRYLATFDQQDDGSFVPVPAARRPGYDLVDAHTDLEAMREKVKAAQQADFERKNAKRKADFDAAVEAEIARRAAAVKPVE